MKINDSFYNRYAKINKHRVLWFVNVYLLISDSKLIFTGKYKHGDPSFPPGSKEYSAYFENFML